ncbi:Tetraspanin-11 [Eumeta japonica]|uniref:Tetraspanin-11 n=1 Tax=Eumeta variegata TaxID=151549 RepID=A0A4C1T1A8_EUMVA|nr:Tetraspanin-11 [Eumeta japonica]
MPTSSQTITTRSRHYLREGTLGMAYSGAMDSCGRCMKICLITINILTFIGGAVAVAVGGWVWASRSFSSTLLASNMFIASVGVVVVMGFAVMLLSILGCCGAAKEVKCMLLTYYILVLIIFLAMLVGGILQLVFREKIMSSLDRELSASIPYYGARHEYTRAWDETQTLLQCCGVRSYRDWNDNLPESCCREVYPGQRMDCKYSPNVTNMYSVGCLEVTTEFLRQNAAYIGIIAIVVAVIMVKAMKAVIDDRVPTLNPETTFRPIRLNPFAYRFEKTLNTDKVMLRRINYLQRTGGLVDCWNKSQTENYMRYMRIQRQGTFNQIRKENLILYKRFAEARSDQYTTSELDKLWRVFKDQVIKGAQLPFVLFKPERIDRGMKDNSFEKPPHLYRPRASMEIWVVGGCKMGKVTIELSRTSRRTLANCSCRLSRAVHVATHTRAREYSEHRSEFSIPGLAISEDLGVIIVPNLYCRGGDVCKDNGFGCYNPPGDDPMKPENFYLKHSVPGKRY